MSSDNGIYILHTRDGYRVAHANAIENLWWNEKANTYTEFPNPDMIYDYFYNAKCHKDLHDAMEEAFGIYNQILHSDYPILEYGIQIIEEFRHLTFEDIISHRTNV